MKKIRGIVVLAVVLATLAMATTTTQAACYTDAKGNIVWCSDSTDPASE